MLGHASGFTNPQLQQLYGAPPRKVLLTGRGAAVARPAQSQAAPPAPPSGPFPLRNRVPRNWKSTETGCTLLSFCCWFLGGKDIARARATCKMMLAKLEMGEIVEIAKSRGIRVTSVVMNGKEVKPTTAQLLRAMYRLETVYIEETFTTSDWGKKWLRGPLSVDEQNQAVDLRECKVVEMTKNSDEENPVSPLFIEVPDYPGPSEQGMLPLLWSISAYDQTEQWSEAEKELLKNPHRVVTMVVSGVRSGHVREPSIAEGEHLPVRWNSDAV
ncbi:hypothetical protein FOZ62_006536 [Perkinsus olseni]|uniref:Uncharacterized protein n=1 Tax=Perkinsus olseni TaxID=32597 RepID=A0A7J6RRM2_PEROL|nr:hypothetical protein FOZ62_006536 [Perkinsus olseni]